MKRKRSSRMIGNRGNIEEMIDRGIETIEIEIEIIEKEGWIDIERTMNIIDDKTEIDIEIGKNMWREIDIDIIDLILLIKESINLIIMMKLLYILMQYNMKVYRIRDFTFVHN